MAAVSEQQRNGDFTGIDASRRYFITRFAAAVFAAPAITSFALDGIAQASAQHRDDGPGHHYHSNQSYCNQFVHNQKLFNQCIANQHLHNQRLFNQTCGNQTEGPEPWLPWERDPSWWKHEECLPFDHHHRRRGHWFL